MYRSEYHYEKIQLQWVFYLTRTVLSVDNSKGPGKCGFFYNNIAAILVPCIIVRYVLHLLYTSYICKVKGD